MFLNHKPLDLLRMWSFNTLSQISLYAHVLVDAMDSGTVESIEDDTALLGSAIECSSAWSLCFVVWPRNRRLPHKEYESSRIACWEYVQHGATWWNDTLSTSCPRNTFGLSRKLCGSGSRKRRIFHRRLAKVTRISLSRRVLVSHAITLWFWESSLYVTQEKWSVVAFWIKHGNMIRKRNGIRKKSCHDDQ